jgi:hypothetical protein
MSDEAEPGSTEHQTRAETTRFRVAAVFLSLALVALVGGAVMTFMGFLSPTEFEVFGARLSTLHVGGALIAVGFITAVATIRSVWRSINESAALPPDEEAEPPEE